MRYQIKWLSDNWSDCDVGDIFTVDEREIFCDKAKDERQLNRFTEGVDYVRMSSNVVPLVRYNGKLYDKQAFEDAISGLIVYEVEDV